MRELAEHASSHTDHPLAKRRSHRRFGRFGLRFLALAVMVSSLAFAWFGARLRAERSRFSSLKKLDSFGATFDAIERSPVIRDDEAPDDPFGDPFAGNSRFQRDPFGRGSDSSISRYAVSDVRLSDWLFGRVCDWIGEEPPLHVEAISMIDRVDGGSAWDDDQMRWLAGIGEVDQLELICDKLSPQSAEHVFSLGGLDYLALETESIDADWRQWRRADQLTSFELSGTRLGPSQLRGLGQLGALEYLELSRVVLTGHAADIERATGCLGNLKKLRSLSLHEVDSEFWSMLPEMDSVRTLYLSNQNDTPQSALSDLLASVPNLETLHLVSDVELTSGHFSALAMVSQLTVFRVAQAHVSADGIAEMAKHIRPRYLALDGVGADDAAMASIGSMKSLEHLVVSNNAFGDDGLGELDSLKGLRVIDLEDTLVSTQAKIDFLRRNPQCREAAAFMCGGN